MKYLIRVLFSIIYFCFGRSDNSIVCESYMTVNFFRFHHNNWGDDLNKYLFEFVSGKKVINLPINKILFKVENAYSLIGSILNMYDLSDKTVYGSGVMKPNDPLRGTPKRVLSVRGPESRQVLLANGIPCPEHYGDPAILLPVFYSPKTTPSNRGCVIVNSGTSSDLPVIEKMCTALNLDVVSMTDYDAWTDVIDKIVSSTYVISESLHGLIVAETYGIPNVWVEFKEHPEFWNFKFDDYYGSIGKSETIIKIRENIDFEMIDQKVIQWQKGKIDYSKMLSYFPFPVKCPINEMLLKKENVGGVVVVLNPIDVVVIDTHISFFVRILKLYCAIA